jgi:PAS domain S-box-containing protein
VVGAVVFVLAWIWGRWPGGIIAVVVILSNGFWADSVGLHTGGWISIVIDAIGIGAIAFLVGHIAASLEQALGAREQVSLAYDELEAAARDRMLTITDKVPIGLYRTTPDGRIIGGNDALMKILGFSDQQSMLATNVLNHYVDEVDRAMRQEILSGGEPTWNEYRLAKADGSVMWVRDWALAVSDDEGDLAHFDGVLEDITEQHLADERFRAAFEDSPYGMAIATADGYMLRGNTAVSDLLGIPLDELTNVHFSSFTFEEDMDIAPKALAKAIAGDTVRYEKRVRRADGSSFWALISLAPIRDASNPQLVISHVIDITERHLAKEGLENLVRSKDELIAGVSHELRTPLTVVHGLAQELDSSWMSFSVPEQKEFISMIAQQSAEVANIVEDLLVAARADIGKLPIHPATVDLREQIESAQRAVPDRHIELKQCGDSAPVAFADPSRVRQIVRNLLVNASRYGGPEIGVRYGSSDGQAWLEVLDNGSGVAAADAAKIFEPYERAHNAAGQPMSVGLGLTVSRTLASLMGGTIRYSYDNGWSVFRLELPIPGAVHSVRSSHSAGGN